MNKKWLVTALATAVVAGGGIGGAALNNAFAEEKAASDLQHGIEVASKLLNGTVTGAELEHIPTYHLDAVDVAGKKYEVQVDAKKGKVLKAQADVDTETNDDMGETDQLEADDDQEAAISLEEAQKIASASFEGAIGKGDLGDLPVYRVEITAQNGQAYEVDVDVETDLIVNIGLAETDHDDEQVIKDDKATDSKDNDQEVDDNTERLQVVQAAKLTLQQAIDAAMKKQPGTLDSIELEDEDGTIVYTVAVFTDNKQEYEVKVDANSGAILKVEQDKQDDKGENEEQEDQD
ncbi:PepSY domain-containing protein [Brevibacillus choshinensis]|uniref:PepSY domain-containing protein n=1 Tax=Brevibacillus choshinensis TaxID=54911 RepID=A0ABX7FKQ0_BRECH|nr:PepSY domain-containing protein [Brevibacillus choshinensis]QRG65575.1 PepSY domain-containing protein [Brevibacillus choshinensis]